MPGVTTGLNWSGYLADAGADSAAYTAVSGGSPSRASTPPTCLPESDVSTWVGLGGFNLVGGRRALLQVGTSVENDVTTGTEVWAWYQYLVTDVAGRQVGGGETTRLPIKVRQGDRIQVLVSVAGAAYFTSET